MIERICDICPGYYQLLFLIRSDMFGCISTRYSFRVRLRLVYSQENANDSSPKYLAVRADWLVTIVLLKQFMFYKNIKHFIH